MIAKSVTYRKNMKMTERKKKHRQHTNVTMDGRGHLRVGGIVIPYYPAYMWGGMGSGTTNADTTTTEGAGHDGNTGADGGSGTDGGGSM